MVVALLYASRHLKKAKAQTSFTCNNSLSWRTDTSTNVSCPTPRTHAPKQISIKTSAEQEKTDGDNDGFNYYVSAAFYTLIGLEVELQTTDGDVYEGILETVAASAEFHIAGARLKEAGPGNQDEGTEHEGESTCTYSKVVAFKDIVYCRAKEVDVEFGKRDELLIDADISRGIARMELKERDLVQWQPDADVVAEVEDLGDLGDVGQRSGWDFDEMIRLHEQKHGTYSTFDRSMSTYMSPYNGIEDDIRAALADKTSREIQMQSKSAHVMPDDLISEEESKSEDDMKSDDGSKTSEYPKSSDEDLKSEDARSEDELKSEKSDEEGHEDSGIGEDMYSSVSSTPPPTPTDTMKKPTYHKHNDTDNYDAASSNDGNDDDNHIEEKSPPPPPHAEKRVERPSPKEEGKFDVSVNDGSAMSVDDGFTVSRSRSRRRSRRKKKQQEDAGAEAESNVPGNRPATKKSEASASRNNQQNQQQSQRKQPRQQQKQQQQNHQEHPKEQLQKSAAPPPQQHQRPPTPPLQPHQQPQTQQSPPQTSTACSYRNVLSYSAVTMRKSEECPSGSSTPSATPCRRSSASSTSSTSSTSLTTQISCEEYPVPQTLKKPKTKHN